MGDAESTARWLLLIHQLPPSPAYLRVKTARQLQKLGAVAVKNSVYVLPNNDACQERFAWLAKEIAAGGGEATLCESSFVGATSNEAMRELFHAARRRDYEELAEEARAALKALGRAAEPGPTKRAAGESALARLRRRMGEIVELDFFGAPGRETVAAFLATLGERLAPQVDEARAQPAPARVKGAVWVTRVGVHVDRIASAWLIRRFIDPDARFKFVPAKDYQPAAGELRYDMFEAEHTHEGDRCTFEVLAQRFGVVDAAVEAIGQVVHDIDVGDGRFGRPETPGVQRLINGIALTKPSDEDRFVLGAQLLDALYESWRRKKP